MHALLRQLVALPLSARPSYTPCAAYVVFVEKVALQKVLPETLQSYHHYHSTNAPYSFISTIFNAI